MKIHNPLLSKAGLIAGMLGYPVVSYGNANAEEAQNLGKPNILWFFIKDMNPLLGCYGVELIQTPHMDRLAENSVLFEHAIVPSPVCSPCRSAIMTSTQPTTLELHNNLSSRAADKIYLP